MHDANGLYYMRARYYHPELKRFLNRDVLKGDIWEGQTLNRYAYVNGDPVSYVDPLGLEKQMVKSNSVGSGNAGWLSGNNGEVNWKSKPNFGHTFDTHGMGKKNLESLKGRARTVNELGNMTEQGQWLNNEIVADFLNSHGKIDKPTIVNIPQGLGQIIKPSWDIIPAERAVIIPNSKTGKIKTAYPVSDTFVLK
ncbi:RHS repeat-associated core domain-containing protein [Paenibacillus turicensis]|uniref:RHS repeat-associated core domain-containing protein n=1 Tax=Paenibacillus turicensis TaxID=160487 RepID=UPI003D26DBD0